MTPLPLTTVLHLCVTSPSAPLEPVPVANDHYSETYTAIADLQDGTYAQIQVGISSLGPGDERGMCRALVVSSDGHTWKASARGDSRTWTYASDPTPVLRVNSCSITQNADTVEIVAELDGRRLQLRLSAAITPVRPPDGSLSLPGGHGGLYESDILVPWARATLQSSREGGTPHSREGHAYLDHSRSTALPDGMARGWIRFRALAGLCRRLVLLRQPPTGKGAVGWSWVKDAPQPAALSVPELVLPAPDGALDTPLRIASDQESFVITRRSMLYTYAPIEELGLVGRLVKAWFGNPTTRTYRADYHGSSDECRDVPGILEITHVKD